MSASRGRREAPEHLGFDDLTADRLATLQGRDFEHFCRALLEVECGDRHPGAKIRGPFKAQDGGKDLVVRLHGPPSRSKGDYEHAYGLALTEDDAPVCFSCKTGSGWRKTVLDEANRAPGGRIPGPIDFLREGGHFVVLLNESPPRDARHVPHRARSASAETVVEGLRRRFAQLLEQTPASLDGRIHILTADDLTAYIRRRRPIEIGERNLRRLGIERIGCVKGVAAWRRDHEHERVWPEFVPDDLRRAIASELWSLFEGPPEDAAQRIFWIHGLPGVGKTRLLLDLFERQDSTGIVRKRTRVAFSSAEGREAIEGEGIFERYPGTILVVDDCAADFVPDLVRLFLRRRARLSERSVLVLLTPGQVEAADIESLTRRGVAVRKLSPLSVEAREDLVRSVLGEHAGPEILQKINLYSEGFPWYAVLIARGLRESPGAAFQTAGEAARVVLKVGTVGMTGAEQRRRVNERARCLLAAMLTDQVSWADLADEERKSICRAVDLDAWSTLEERADECIRSGLLRMRYRQTFKYVTPQILAREVALMLLHPPDGGPRSPLGPRIREHAPRYASVLFELLDRLDVAPDGEDPAIVGLTHDVLAEIRAGEDVSVLGRPGISGAPVRFVVRRAPGPAADAVRRLVERTPPSELPGSAQRDLSWALEALSRRRAGFDDAEAALFRLACAEKKAALRRDAGSTNAISTWAELFLVGMNPTCKAFAEKLALLRARCSEEDPTARQVALLGVAQATFPSVRFVGQELDGAQATPQTPAEIREAKIAAWTLLLEALDDGAAEVQEQARKQVLEHLHLAMQMGLADPVATMIAAKLDRFDDRSMIALREQIELIKAHDMERIQRSAGGAAWSSLVEAAAPRSFRERLRQAVGTWHRGDPSTEQAELARLATDAMSDAQALSEELDWLDSNQAARSVRFFITLGKQDAAAVLLPVFLARIAQGKGIDAWAAYLKGHEQSQRKALVDGELRRLRQCPGSAEAVAVALWRLGATDEQMAWMTGYVEGKQVPEGVLRLWALGGWERGVSDESLRAFVASLVAHGGVDALRTALTLAVSHPERRTGTETEWLSLLEPMLDSLTDRALGVVGSDDWGQGLALLVRWGAVEMALSLSLRALGEAEQPWFARNAWTALLACKEKDPVATWRAFARLLDGSDPYRFTVSVVGEGVGEGFPVEEVMSWVDGVEGHAIAAARLCATHTRLLSPLARALLIRFGPDSRVAGEIALRVASTPGARLSLADSSRAQAEHARGWAEDPHPHVRMWARRVQKHLEADMERHEAYEEHNRHWGT